MPINTSLMLVLVTISDVIRLVIKLMIKNLYINIVCAIVKGSDNII